MDDDDKKSQGDSPEDHKADEKFMESLHAFREAQASNDPSVGNLAMMSVFASAAEAMKDHVPTAAQHEKSRASQFMLDKKYAEAEHSYLKSIELAQEEGWTRFKAMDELSSLYSLLDRSMEARDQARAATATARELDMSTLLMMALQNQSPILLKGGDLQGALRVAEETLELARTDEMFSLFRASALAFRADCYVRLKSLEQANADLDAAHGLISGQEAMTFAAGVQGVFRMIWSTRAKLFFQQGRPADAALARAEAVKYARAIASQPHVAGVHAACGLARELYELAKILSLNGKTAEAKNASLESSALRTAWRLPPLGEAD